MMDNRSLGDQFKSIKQRLPDAGTVRLQGKGKRKNDLSTPRALLNRRFCFVTDEFAVVVFLVVQAIHNFVSFRPGRHFNETKSFGLPRKLINNKLCADNGAKGAAKLGKLRFRNIIWETTDKKFHAFPSLQGGKQELFRYRRIRNDYVGYQKKKMLSDVRIFSYTSFPSPLQMNNYQTPNGNQFFPTENNRNSQIRLMYSHTLPTMLY